MCIKLNTLKIENNKLYGTIKARNTDVKVIFDGLHKEDLSLMFEYEFVNCDRIFDKDTIINESDHRIYVTKGVTRKIFIKAIVEIFASAFAKADEK